MDKRVMRTRETLQHALMSLIVTRGYDAIRVQDICEAANVGRSTFYAHYTDKDDLKRSALDRLKSELRFHSGERLGFLAALFDHGRGQLSLYRAISGTPAEAITLKALGTILSEIVEEDLRETVKDRNEREIKTRFAVGATMSVLVAWLDSGATQPASLLSAHLRGLIDNGLNGSHSSGWANYPL